MRRAILVVLLAAASGTRAAHAAPWVVTAEGGAEGDTNVLRVEPGPGPDTSRLAGTVLRFGGRLDRKAKLAGGAYALGLSTLARLVQVAEASAENVALFAGDLRWLHPLQARPVSLGFALNAADAVPITDEIGARTFRNLGADALVVLDGGDDRHLTIGFGARDFVYKENRSFDWSGPAASARLDLALWQPSGGTRSLELAALLAFEARDYASSALTNICPPGAPPSIDCSAGSSLRRRDRFQRAGLEVTWTGGFVATGGYQLTVINSNSYGQSFARHKVSASVTTPLPHELYATVLAQLQIDQYLDGLVVKTDLQRSEFTSLDDENRSTLQVRLGRSLSDAWSLEARGALWRDLGAHMDTSFRRSLLYVGAIFSR
jgi:hypothetical protein